MAWDQQWQHRVDTLELNDLAAGLVCEVPEVDDLFEVENVFVVIAGGYPVFHRAQPQSGRYTFLIHALHETDEEFAAKVAAIRAVMSQGVPHTYTYQVRGMAAPRSVEVVFESLGSIDYKTGRMTALAVAPDPRGA